MDNQQERLASFDFIGGLIVGEGCFSLSVVRNRGRALIQPAFSVYMCDRDTIELVYSTLKHHKLPGYFETRRAKGKVQEQYGIRVGGVKSVDRFCGAIIPYLYGAKARAAENAQAYCKYRLSMPYGSGHSDTDIDFVRTMRSINGNASQIKTPLDQLPSILRDYTPCSSD